MANSLGGGVKPLYNGNISETFWRTGSDNVKRKYGYSYDGLNRLTHAVYQKPHASNPALDNITNAYNEHLWYDKNGNITALQRNGYLDGQANEVYTIDNLVYTYDSSSNMLRRVDDNSNSLDGFRNGNSPDGPGTPDYQYDNRGNMIMDWNKGIDHITYNHLDLPLRLNFRVASGERYISYIYNALGQKVAKQVRDQSGGQNVNTVTEYFGGYQYVGGILQFFPTSEGYVSVIDGKFVEYVYNYTDHLGNIRLSHTNEGGVLKILEENQYYPFGMKHSYNPKIEEWGGDKETGVYAIVGEVERGKYQYKFQGQERQDELGLNWDSFKWRNYDYAIGRFFNIDPLAEDYSYQSPYNFAENRVISHIELEGLEGIHSSIVNAAGNRVHTVEKNVIVLTRSHKVIPDGASPKQVERIAKQNQQIDKTNNERIESVRSELSSFYSGATNSAGEKVNFEFNVTGMNVEDTNMKPSREMTQLALDNGIESSSKAYSNGPDLVAPAAIISTASPGAKHGVTDGVVVRTSLTAPKGAKAMKLDIH